MGRKRPSVSKQWQLRVGGAFMKIYAYNEYSLLFLKLIMYKRKINFALIIIIDAKIIKRTN